MTLEKYLAQRRKLIEERIAEEMLSGNEVKLNQEKSALAELDGVEKAIKVERFFKMTDDGEIFTYYSHGMNIAQALHGVIRFISLETIKTYKWGKK